MIDLIKFIVTHEGRQWAYLGYLGECLSLVKRYIQDMTGIDPPASGTGSAWGYWKIFPAPLGRYYERIEYLEGVNFPTPGDIVIWQPSKYASQYGHIDICVVSYPEAGVFVGFDQNWKGRRSAHLVTHTMRDVIGWLRAK